MAKGYKGYKGSVGKKLKYILVSGTIVLAITFSAWGISRISSSNKQEETESNVPNYSENNPSFETDNNVGTNQSGKYTDGTPVSTDRPTNQDSPATENAKDIFNTVLATLTEKANDYVTKEFNATATLKATGVNYVKIDKASGNIEILGQVSTGDNSFSNMVAKVTNKNTSLSIFNLAEDASAEDAASALDEILKDENSVTEIALKQYINLSNPTEVANSILEARYDALAGEQSDEYAHISECLNNPENVKFSVLLNDRAKTNDGKYSVSITAVVHTGKYVYISDINLTMDKYLANTALSREIEEQLQDYAHTPECVTGASLNKALYTIDQNITEKVKETELAK